MNKVNDNICTIHGNIASAAGIGIAGSISSSLANTVTLIITPVTASNIDIAHTCNGKKIKACAEISAPEITAPGQEAG